MNLTDIHNLYDFNYWAKRRILGVVETLTPEQFSKNLNSSHGGIQGTLIHTMGAEEIWLKRWKGESPASFAKAEEYPSFDLIADHWDMVEHEIMGFCHKLRTDEDLQKKIAYRDLKGNAFTQPLGHLMQHVVNHSTYHRGQVVTMLRQLNVKPVSTDLVAYYREKNEPDGRERH